MDINKTYMDINKTYINKTYINKTYMDIYKINKKIYINIKLN